MLRPYLSHAPTSPSIFLSLSSELPPSAHFSSLLSVADSWGGFYHKNTKGYTDCAWELEDLGKFSALHHKVTPGADLATLQEKSALQCAMQERDAAVDKLQGESATSKERLGALMQENTELTSVLNEQKAEGKTNAIMNDKCNKEIKLQGKILSDASAERASLRTNSAQSANKVSTSCTTHQPVTFR